MPCAMAAPAKNLTECLEPLPPSGEKPAWAEKTQERVWATIVFVCTAAATAGMMPPSRYPELAYVFAVPAVYWAYRAPRWGLYLWTLFAAQAVAWTLTLSWLHHVTWAGLLLLGPVVGAWTGCWFVAVGWVMPRLERLPWTRRVVAVLGLAGAWVVVEWTRTWFLSGFPWLPLAATQWERLTVLQPAAYAGAWSVSFILISVNVAFAAYLRKLLHGVSGGEAGTSALARTRCPEFMLAMALLLLCLFLTVRDTFNRGAFHRFWAQVGIVQPAIPQTIKWDETAADDILRTLEEETLKVAASQPDLLLWPEATTPLAVRGNAGMERWMEALTRQAKAPLLFGSIGYENLDTPEERWSNGVFVATPEGGVEKAFYAKRHLVPFGEYVPLRPVLGWLEKVVPVGGDFSPGQAAGLLRVPVREAGALLGALICYEDIFPALARESVAAGAEVLVVNTNNGWFGEGAAAYQHAAHSVLRAVETRRPVLRAGNAGWSGWIDECGAIRAVLTRDLESGEVRTEPAIKGGTGEGSAQGTVYFRGGATLGVTRDARFLSTRSLYVRWGDWFVAVSAGLATGAWWLLRACPRRSLGAGHTAG